MNLDKLTYEEQERLKEYLSSIKEIRKEVSELLNKCGYELSEDDDAIRSTNHSSGLTMPIENKVDKKEESINEMKKREYSRLCENKTAAEELIDKIEDIFPNVETTRKKQSENNRYLVKFWI